MLKTYLKTALRNFKSNKKYSFVNLAGLCIVLTCALLIFVYVRYELSYENFFNHPNRIYRIEAKINFFNAKNMYYINLNSYLDPRPIKSISGIKHQIRFATLATEAAPLFARANQKKIALTKVWAADSSFFKIFNFYFIAGDPGTALMHTNSIVLTQQTAQKFFGNQPAVGQPLTLLWKQKQIPLIVRGVVKVPSNTHLQFHAITSKAVIKNMYGFPLSQATLAYDYLKLGKGQNPAKIAKELTSKSKAGSHGVTYRLEPIPRIHLYSHARHELSPNGNIRYIYFLIAIAFILLIIAGINFTSLATAQNLQRFKEAGIRKVLGAYRRQLTGQFLAEMAGITLFALIISYIIVYFILPVFNRLTGMTFHFADFFHPVTLIVFIGGTIVLGLLAGLYPAVLFSSFQPTRTLKGTVSSGRKGASLWKSIVVIQFAITIAMIICTLTIFRQMRYIQHKDLGFNKSHIIDFPNYFDGNNYKTFKTRVEKLNGVKSVAISSYFPGTSKTSGTTPIYLPGQSDTLTFNWISTGYNYLTTYGIKLKKGRYFSPKHATDSTKAVVINEAAVKALHLEHPIGKHLTSGFGNRTIIGVTQNFNFLSLYQKIPPIIFVMDSRLYFNFSVKFMASSNPSMVISRIKHVFHNFLPNTPFQYQFVSQQFNALYRTDRQMGRMFGIFAILALFVSCLGLFSLSSFMAARKTKEIGIRKVLGASTKNILSSFYKSYSLLVGIACLFAVPASYFFLRGWLQNYAYRIGMPVWAFLAAIAATLVIAFMAVSFESVKASLANPAESIEQ